MRIIAGTARGRRIDAPEGLHTRPTLDRVRENLFNILQLKTRGSRVLDLFAGSGALSLEALSRGAEHAVLVDIDRGAHRIQRKNLETLGFEDRAETMLCDWRKAAAELENRGRYFDLIFLDPPYRITDLRDVFEAVRRLTDKDGLVILEHEGKAEIETGDAFERIDERRWGYCGVSFFRLKSDPGTEETV